MAACESISLLLHSSAKLIAKQKPETQQNHRDTSYHWRSDGGTLLIKRLWLKPPYEALSVVREHYFAGSGRCGLFCACAKGWFTVRREHRTDTGESKMQTAVIWTGEHALNASSFTLGFVLSHESSLISNKLLKKWYSKFRLYWFKLAQSKI